MTTRSQSGSFRLNVLGDGASDNSKTMIDMSADLAEQPSDLFEKVAAFTFDVLGHQAADQHGYEAGAPLPGSRLRRAL